MPFKISTRFSVSAEKGARGLLFSLTVFQGHHINEKLRETLDTMSQNATRLYDYELRQKLGSASRDRRDVSVNAEALDAEQFEQMRASERERELSAGRTASWVTFNQSENRPTRHDRVVLTSPCLLQTAG